MVLFRFFLQDCQTQLIFRRLYVCDHSLDKAGLDPLLQGEHLSGGPVAGDDDLLAVFVKGVEGVEKFLLGGGFSGYKLNVVDEQHVGFAVFFPKAAGGLSGYGFDELVHEVFAFGADDAHMGPQFVYPVGDGIHEVGFSQTAGTVDKQGIVIVLSPGIVGHSHAAGVGKLIGRTHDKIFKGVFWTKPLGGKTALRVRMHRSLLFLFLLRFFLFGYLLPQDHAVGGNTKVALAYRVADDLDGGLVAQGVKDTFCDEIGTLAQEKFSLQLVSRGEGNLFRVDLCQVQIGEP